MKKLTHQQREQAIALYVSGLSLRGVAHRLGVTSPTILGYLREAGIHRRPHGASQKLPLATQEDIVAMYVDGFTLNAVALKHGVSVMSVRSCLRRRGIASRKSRGLLFLDKAFQARIRRPRGSEHCCFKALDTKAASALYRSGLCTSQIGFMFGMSGCAVSRKLKEAGVRVRKGGYARKRKCHDGHIADSGLECIVDNWLHAHAIPHDIHPHAPWYVGGKSPHRSDFKIGDTYIEVWGMTGVSSYDAKTTYKRSRYQQCGADLIELTPQEVISGDLSKLDRLLTRTRW